ncbi:MAG: aminotransferase class V-fold PLP-dependent enzyme, partial [Chlamydiae bacterium]|nr:aminotransferase class V-fold PLP-dependent enzyme [Chlamydiota bacterium]
MGIYLDSHTASRPFPSSIERMHALFKVAWGSLSAPHQIGQDALSVANTSLQIIYDFLGASEKDIFTFTSSGSEAISQVFLSTYTDYVRENGKNHFMTTALEGASIF